MYLHTRSLTVSCLALACLLAIACESESGGGGQGGGGGSDTLLGDDSVSQDAGGDVSPDGAGAAPYRVHEWGVVTSTRLMSSPTHYVSMDDKPILYFYADAPLDVDVAVSIVGGAARETWPEVELGTELSWPGLHLTGAPCEAATPFPGPGEGQCPSPWEEPCEARELGSFVVDEASCLELGEVSAPLLFYAGALDEPFVPVSGSFSLEEGATSEVEVSLDLAADFVGRVFVVYRDLDVEPQGFDGFVTIGRRHGWTYVDVPAGGASGALSASLQILDQVDEARPALEPSVHMPGAAEALRELLLERGLSEAEADAFMVAWAPIFFGATALDGHPGVPPGESLSVIGVHARSDYDALMPLSLTPAPEELVRVLVSHTWF